MVIKRLSLACVLIIALLFSSFTYSKDNFKSMDLKGKINNNYDIHMKINPGSVNKSTLEGHLGTFLRFDGVVSRYSGYYYYDKYAKKIPIDGYLYSGGYFELTEYDEKNKTNGGFYGFIKDDKIIKGVWSNSKKKYPFYLFDSKMNPGDFDLNAIIDKVGSYDRIGNNKVDIGYLYIYAEGNGKLTFEISGFWVNPAVKNPCAHEGMVDGIAVYTDASRNRAEYFNKDDNLKIHFKFSGNQVEITANDVISNYGGLNVSLVGTFKKKK